MGWDWAEAAGQLAFAAPLVATSVAYYAIPLVSVMYAGRLGDLQLAAATLGNSRGTVTGIALMTGLSGSLETLCGQGYGAGEYRMMGVHLQASLLTSALFSVLVSLLWLYTEPLLVLLRQDPEASRLAAVFLRCQIPAQFAYGFIQCTLRFLQAQSVATPLVAFSLLPLAVHVGITHAFVDCLGLGFAGAAMSTSVSLWLSLLMLAAYVRLSDAFRDTWGGFTAEAFRHVLPGMKLAIPSIMCLPGAVDGSDMRPPLPELRPAAHHPDICVPVWGSSTFKLEGRNLQKNSVATSRTPSPQTLSQLTKHTLMLLLLLIAATRPRKSTAIPVMQGAAL